MSQVRAIVTVGLGVLLVAAFLATPVAAQRPGLADTTGIETYGTAASVAHTIMAWEFDTLESGAITATVAAPMGAGAALRYGDGTFGSNFVAGVRLPAGALVTSIEVEACDNSPTRNVSFGLVKQAAPAGMITFLTGGDTSGGMGVPGCGLFPATLTVPETIDNRNNIYFLFVATEAGDSSTRFAAARVFYQLQVSAGPATATFGDVPTTHPFFRFVEALVAAGITGGCGGGNYCPNDPLTRGQMAVFLATALGLQFAP